ncbi:hypothetical protein TWF225_007139 [Orbilia oligospora]|uniref:Uncharacterized protein n=1 Tax=Orbilia oligospora TaxID=2813651 RepID=A0A7C8P6X4_ORBOL|nr:hypothetical protein TWF751_009642 [Orbilia oligospora]KAF3180774.1 hypothetical protein TWF225_007139 [Orbilia oligospora]KAF3236305.1 hypothetical protein TWF217_002573 [Orbilia oligospora]KAF3245993.1 hypothetical protein TWF128_009331 [Orbilia oligospora]KAF3287268.1 hypothetical protein TWF132_008635 [Orbilia oligospora]
MSEVSEPKIAIASDAAGEKLSTDKDKDFDWFSLPGEIRDQIYEALLPFEVNFVYNSPWVFPDYNHSYKAMKNLPGGISFEFSPFPEPAIRYYSQVSSRFGAELSDCLDRQRHRVLKALEDCTSGTAAWNTDFDGTKITPKLLELISRSRFIFASFGHTTKNIIEKLDKRVKNNVHNIFITQSMISSTMPGNLYKWSLPPFSEYGKLLQDNFPNLEKVAVEVRQARKDLGCLVQVMDWYDTGKIKQLELVYHRKRRDAAGEVWGWPYSGYQFKDEATVEDCYELLWEFAFEDRPPAWKWKVQTVDEDEVNERGRFFTNCEYPYAGRETTMIEGTVFRLVREPNGTFEGASEEENLKFIKACHGQRSTLVRRSLG